MISCSFHVSFSQIVLRLKNMADLDLSKSLSQTNFGNPDQIKDLMTALINRTEQQDKAINYLKSENDHLLSENSLFKDRVLKLERYSSKLSLIFLGLQTDGDPLAAVLGIIRNVLRVNINQEDLAACHYLPSRNQIKPTIIKFLYHHQKDLVWRNRKELMKNDKTKCVYIVKRLAEWDRDVVNYAKNQQLLVTTNNCQPTRKSGESWVQVNSKNDVDKVSNRHRSLEYDKSARRSSTFVPIRRNDSKFSTGAFDLNTETNIS